MEEILAARLLPRFVRLVQVRVGLADATDCAAAKRYQPLAGFIVRPLWTTNQPAS
jgi:hypothetical protein